MNFINDNECKKNSKNIKININTMVEQIIRKLILVLGS